MSPPLLFALAATRTLGERVAAALGQPLAALEEREFEDGEHKSRPLQSVRDRDVYVLQSLHGRGPGSVDQKLIRLLFFLGAVKDGGAARVSAVLPYLCYSRKERRTKPHDPVTTRYVAALLEAVGTDRVVTLDVHSVAAFQNAFRRNNEHLESRHFMVAPVAAAVAGDEVVVFSPDAGGVKRAERFRGLLEQWLGRPVGNGFMEKYRSGGRVSGQLLAGDLAGRTVVIVDDLVAGGGTLARAATACREAGAVRTLAVATHGVLTAEAPIRLGASPLEKVFLTDSIPPFAPKPAVLDGKLQVVESAPFLAEAIRRLNLGASLADMSEAYDT